MNPLNIIKYQLYLLQLESYELSRYWFLLSNKGFYGSKQPLRKELVWTKKIILILVLSILLISILTLWLVKFSSVIALVGLVLSLIFFPIYIILSTIILSPIDYLSKKYLVKKAKDAISTTSNLKIIGIAGSYGKTTMKNVLSSILETKYKVMTTPESVNTPVGIASWFLKEYKDEAEILIVEMGEHYKGDIKEICKLTPPDIAIITGVNEAHLERLKSIETATETIFELAENSKKDALVIMNADDEQIKNNYKAFTAEKRISFYSHKNDKASSVELKKAKFDPKELGWIFETKELGKNTVHMLGKYILGDIAAGIIVGNELGLNIREMKKGIFEIKPVIHRLQPIKQQGNILIIDDSYNGNPDGVEEAIRVLSEFKDRRKLFITPGLVEIGTETGSVHKKIGNTLAGVADRVLLVKNSATPYIEEGLLEKKFSKESIIWFETAESLHANLGQIIRPNDVILFQNDWGDQYL